MNDHDPICSQNQTKRLSWLTFLKRSGTTSIEVQVYLIEAITCKCGLRLILDPISERGMGFSFACQMSMVREVSPQATVKAGYGID